MGLFDKKYCDICGEKIRFLGNHKLEDGNMCGTCNKKMSPFFNGRRKTTVDEMKEYSWLDGMKMLWMSGAIFLLAWAITLSSSKSVVVRRPRMMHEAPLVRAKEMVIPS